MTNDKQRERLVELLQEADQKVQEYILENDHMDWIPKVNELLKVQADHLLANGVIVPTVKVGQTVYRTSGNLGGKKIYKGFIDQVTFHYDGQPKFYVYGHPLSFIADDIGKTVFLSREEAEEALGGVQG